MVVAGTGCCGSGQHEPLVKIHRTDVAGTNLRPNGWALAVVNGDGPAGTLLARYRPIQAKNTENWTRKEQAGMLKAADPVKLELEKQNRKYEKKFGYIFIVFATGKSAEEMLDLLQQRLGNIPMIEINIAACEQNKITILRL